MTKDDAIKAIEGLQYVQDGVLLIEFQYYNQALQDAIEAIRALPDAGWKDISEAREAIVEIGRLAESLMTYDGEVYNIAEYIISAQSTALKSLPQPPEKA
jgi:hypothetical protein